MNSEYYRILVCILVFSEAKNIAEIITKAKNYAYGVIVYYDGSADDTFEVTKSPSASVIRNSKNNGFGVEIRSLFQPAKEQNADIMVTIDSDGQHDPEQIPKLIKPIVKQGFDLVIVPRFLDGNNKEKVPNFRSFGIKTITKLGK